MFQIKIDDNTNLILIWPHRHFQQNLKVLFCQKYRWWSPKNALPVCCHQICWWFKYRYLESWKMCYWYTVNEFVCSLSTVLNTGTLSSKNALPVYCNLLFVVAIPVENKCQIWKIFQMLLFFSIFYIKNESLDTSGVSK